MTSGRLEAFSDAVIAFVAPFVSFALYAGVAAMWIVPDRRIERRISA